MTTREEFQRRYAAAAHAVQAGVAMELADDEQRAYEERLTARYGGKTKIRLV